MIKLLTPFFSFFVKEEPKSTIKTFFDISIGKEKIGRIIFGLYGNIVPKTVRILRRFALEKKEKI